MCDLVAFRHIDTGRFNGILLDRKDAKAAKMPQSIAIMELALRPVIVV